MKKIISLLLALLAVVSFASCGHTDHPTTPTAEPTEAPSQEPTAEPTPEPTAEPTPEPTPEPILGYTDLLIILDTEGTNKADIDLDGRDDTITFFPSEPNENGEIKYTVMVRTSTGVTHESSLSYYSSFAAYIVDCDPTDGKLELLYSGEFSTGDRSLDALRMNESKTQFKFYSIARGVSPEIEEGFSSEKGFPVLWKTLVLGLKQLKGYMTLTDEGFVLVSDGYEYVDLTPIKLLKKMNVNLLNKDGSLGEEVSVAKDNNLVPLTTDGESFVTVQLPDGRTGYMTVEIVDNETEWGIYLNGKLQDDYFKVLYM